MLTGSGFVGPATASETQSADIDASQALNRFICKRAEYSDQMRFLAAPTIGSAISVSRIDQLFLRAHDVGAANVPKWVWDLLESQGQRLIKHAKTLEDPKENLAQLRVLYEEFLSERQPILQAVKAIADGKDLKNFPDPENK